MSPKSGCEACGRSPFRGRLPFRSVGVTGAQESALSVGATTGCLRPSTRDRRGLRGLKGRGGVGKRALKAAPPRRWRGTTGDRRGGDCLSIREDLWAKGFPRRRTRPYVLLFIRGRKEAIDKRSGVVVTTWLAMTHRKKRKWGGKEMVNR